MLIEKARHGDMPIYIEHVANLNSTDIIAVGLVPGISQDRFMAFPCQLTADIRSNLSS